MAVAGSWDGDADGDAEGNTDGLCDNREGLKVLGGGDDGTVLLGIVVATGSAAMSSTGVYTSTSCSDGNAEGAAGYELGSLDAGSSVTGLPVILSVGAVDCTGADDGKTVGTMPLGGELSAAAVGSTVGKAVKRGTLGMRVDGWNDGLKLGCEVGADVGGGVHV
jgi:hypothetical protein